MRGKRTTSRQSSYSRALSRQWRGFVVLAVMSATIPSSALAQHRAPNRFTMEPAARVAQSALPGPMLHQREDRFNFAGFVVFGAIGVIGGGFIGYHADRYFGLFNGDDRGAGGMVIGAILGGTAGAIYGGHLGND